MPTKTFTPREFASIVGVNRTTIWRHISSGLLPLNKDKQVTDATVASIMHSPSYAVWIRLRKRKLSKKT